MTPFEVASNIRPYKLVVDRVFYVGGLGSDKRAEVVAAADYAASKPDMLCKHANAIVDTMNGRGSTWTPIHIGA